MHDEPHLEAAMYGTVMRGMPHHDRIAGAGFLRDARTAPRYRLWTVGGEYPLMVPDGGAGGAIEVQLFSVPRSTWRSKVELEPEGLLEGEIELDDGRRVAAMLGDPDWSGGRDDVRDITSYGGWRAFVDAAAHG
jgi:gamma-glutamylcyclotransferase (GGCT)/AIG2-like uncharacterized protein YtfP